MKNNKVKKWYANLLYTLLGVVPKENEYGKIMIDETYNIYDASPCDRCKYDNNRGIMCDSCDEYGDNTYYA